MPEQQTDDAVLRPVPPAKPVPADLIQSGGTAAPAAAPDAGLSLTVSQFQFSGNTALSAEQLAPLVAPYVGKALTLEQLNRAAEAVQGHYRGQGWFLARAYLPPQAPQDGVVVIAILEGKIDKVQVNVAADAPIRPGYAERVVNARIASGQLITESGIERPLLQLRDLPRIDAKSVIEPGSAIGTASITVDVVKDPDTSVLSGRVEVDNYGTRSTGNARLTGEINVNNPYGLGDVLSLRGFIANAHGNAFGRAAYTVPVDANGTKLGASVARLNYQLGKEFAALDLNGVANVVSVNASNPLIRTKNANLLGQVIVERKKLKERTGLLNTDADSTITAGRLQINGDLRDNLAGITVYSLGLSRGKLALEDAEAIANDNAGPHTAGSFAKLIYSVQRLQQFSAGLHGLASVSGQRSNKNLNGAEKFSIGGEGTVRAFPTSEAIGDHGYAATLEMRYTLAALSNDRRDTVATVFYDYGNVTYNHSQQAGSTAVNSRTLGGYGIGLNVGVGEHFQLKLSVARPTQGRSAGSSGTRAWIQMGYGF